MIFFSFQNLWHKQKFSLDERLPKLIKRLQKLHIYPYQK
jgi:hypothetical protein